MDGSSADEQRPSKRRKTQPLDDSGSSPLLYAPYITFAHASYSLNNLNTDVHKSLLKELPSRSVEIIEVRVTASKITAQFRVPWLKSITTTTVYSRDDRASEILADGAKLFSTAPNSRKKPVDVPLACCDAVLHLVGDRAVLDIRLLWHDTAQARERVDPELLGMFWRYRPHGRSAPSQQAEEWDVREFYDNVHVPAPNDNLDFKVDLLQCQLYPFQKRATRWLLSREGVTLQPSGQVVASSKMTDDALPLDFDRATDVEGRECFASHSLGVVCSSEEEILAKFGFVSGGILAEAMGLGKTVEMIALMCLHSSKRSPHKRENMTGLMDTGATLIITPPTILEQWKQEIREHAPSLRVYHYEGATSIAKRKTLSLDLLADQDVVLTTYNVIAKEVHYVKEKPDRNLRSRPRAEPPKSPLTQILWWRCLLDEAQMIESGVSNAATVARLIPRVHAWAVTGTPLKQSHRDLYGLLLFLRQQPWCISTRTWEYLVFYQRQLLRGLISEIALRHSKELVREELRLPPQARHTITMPFTAIEESHYAQMNYDMQQDCGLDKFGAPLEDDWDSESPVTIEKMRTWLMRLRQTCLHPEVGGRNRKALGRSGGPLRTVAQVLDVMIEQTDSIVHVEQRNVLMLKIRRGQMLEHAKRPVDAQKLYQEAYDVAVRIAGECRKDLVAELEKQRIAKGRNENDDMSEESEDEDEEMDASQLAARQRMRSALEVQHICVFFLGNTHFQLKELEENKLSKDDAEQTAQKNAEKEVEKETSKGQEGNLVVNLTTTSSSSSNVGNGQTQEGLTSDFKPSEPANETIAELEKLETEAYEEAKSIRTELLSEVHRKANRRITTVRVKDASDGFVKLPSLEYAVDDFGGIESRKVFEKLYHFCKAMNLQAEQFQEVRAKMTGMLRQALIDEDEGVDLTGEEYEASTKHQDEMYVVMEMLRALFADRNDAITGQENLLLRQETKQFMKDAKEGQGPAPELMMKLLSEREQKRIRTAEQGSLRGIVNEIRSLASSLEWQEVTSSRAKAELVIVNRLLQYSQQLIATQTKAVSALEQEVNLFRDTMNARLDYYRALQKISDTVAPYGDEETIGKAVNDAAFEKLLKDEEGNAKKLSTALSKRRYLLHLKNESTGDGSARICTICQFEFEIGTLTVCGHQFCKDCIQMWWSEHRNCPVCKRRLTLADFYDVTYKPAEVVVQAEDHAAIQATLRNDGQDAEQIVRNSIYSDVKASTLREIKNVDIRGASFGSKVDTICRHLHWLRDHDPGSKTIIFSQYRDFLDVLGRALRQNGIIHSKFDEKDGIIDFKSNPANECFLLHAKAHSAGLNLVVASHVILCEPLINTALELQAIARVHRIGQQRATTVWMYLIKDTVEESIYEISVRRRLAHMPGKRSDKGLAGSKNTSATTSRAVTPGPEGLRENEIDAANSKELQAADLSKMLEGGRSGGEKVDKVDLWQCLFGRAEKAEAVQGVGSLLQTAPETSMPAASDVGSFLRAEAAEQRRNTTT